MNREKADKIYQEIEEEWVKRYGRENLNPKTMNAVKMILREVPDEDGCKRVKCMGTDATHLVPIKDIILNGLKGEDVAKYPVEK